MLSPHTSYPPLEMAATGGLVVTNTYGPKTADALTAIAPSIRAAAPDVEALAQAIAEAVAALDSSPSPSTPPPTGLYRHMGQGALPTSCIVAAQVRELRGAS